MTSLSVQDSKNRFSQCLCQNPEQLQEKCVAHLLLTLNGTKEQNQRWFHLTIWGEYSVSRAHKSGIQEGFLGILLLTENTAVTNCYKLFSILLTGKRWSVCTRKQPEEEEGAGVRTLDKGKHDTFYELQAAKGTLASNSAAFSLFSSQSHCHPSRLVVTSLTAPRTWLTGGQACHL